MTPRRDLNRRFGCPGRHPRCTLVSEAVSRHDLAAAYRRSRIGLVTPIRGRDEPGCEGVCGSSESRGSRRADIVQNGRGPPRKLTDALLVDATDTAAVVAALGEGG